MHAAEPLLAARTGAFTALVVVSEPQALQSLVGRLRLVGATDITEATRATDARAAARASGPLDLCLLDLSLPGGALHLLTDLRNAGWRRLLVLSPAADAFSLRAAFQAGAHGYLRKQDGSALLDRAGQVGLRIPAPRSPAASNAGANVDARAWRHLSAREIQVLRLVAAGRSNSAAGEQLELSALTVKSHLARIARKLGTGDRAQMVAVAMRAGIIV